ncbi:MAG TPA: hypothetical protein VLB73_00610 [Patescibacteria group bacterium]|nr:hypothetical protein [Patescibacteria group bacterium]
MVQKENPLAQQVRKGNLVNVSDPAKNSGSAPGPSSDIGTTANPNSEHNSRW